MAAGQLGYAHATPKTWPHNRAKQAEVEKSPLQYPHGPDVMYLMRAMMDLGPMRFAGEVGKVAASWDAIRAFASSSDRHWFGWELKTLHLMCSAYAQGANEGKEPLSVPPAEQKGWMDGKRFQLEFLPELGRFRGEDPWQAR